MTNISISYSNPHIYRLVSLSEENYNGMLQTILLLNLSDQKFRTWNRCISAVQKMGRQDKQCPVANQISRETEDLGSISRIVRNATPELLVLGIPKQGSSNNLILDRAIELA